jgi:hypothetical protein
MVCAPVKAPALVAEQLGLQQILRDGRGVDGHEGAAGALGMLVQRARHQLLAGAGFAGDQHRDVALRQAADGPEHILHRRRLPQHLGRRAHALLGHFLALAFLDGAADQFHRLGQIEGFGQVLEGAALEGGDGAVEVRERRHDDHGQAGQFFLDLAQQVQARAPRHADVADQHLRAALVSRGFQGLEHFARVGEAAGGKAIAQQGLLQHEADRLVIINYPDRLHGAGVPLV